MTHPFDPDWVSAPGETLKDWFDEQELPLAVGDQYGLDQATLERLLVGEEEITAELAEKLGLMTRVSSSFWLARERTFREGLAAGKTWVR